MTNGRDKVGNRKGEERIQINGESGVQPRSQTKFRNQIVEVLRVLSFLWFGILDFKIKSVRRN